MSQFREFFPQARSFLMDRKTLLACRTGWSREAEPSRVIPANLQAAELSLLRKLQSDTYSPAVRLKQELIPFARLEQALAGIV